MNERCSEGWDEVFSASAFVDECDCYWVLGGFDLGKVNGGRSSGLLTYPLTHP